MDMLLPGPPDGGPVGPTPMCTTRAELASFVIDVPAVTLNGKITVNGKIPASMTGTVSLVNASTGDSLLLGRTADMSYAPKLVVPGTYDIVYSWNGQADTGDVPRNARALVRTGVSVQSSGALDVDLPAVTLNGKVTVGGQVPMANTGTVSLRDPKTGDSLLLGRTADASYTPKLVLPGTYDIIYNWNGQSTTSIDVPRNSAARLRAGVPVKSSGALDVDIPAVTLSGKVTVNGQVPMATTGTVSLADKGSGDSLFLGATGAQTYTPKLVVPGTYDIVYNWNGQSTTPIDVPRNSAARLRTGVPVQSSGALDVDIPAVTLSGKVTVNGQIPMATAGTVSLADKGSGDSLLLGSTGAQSYIAKLVVPGTYDVFYSYSNVGATTIDIPRNQSARVRTGVAVKVSGALDVDIPAVTISGKVTVNGQQPMAATGQVLLGNPATADSVLVGRTADPSYTPKLVVPAPYNIVYGWTGAADPADDVPRNLAALLGCKLLM